MGEANFYYFTCLKFEQIKSKQSIFTFLELVCLCVF